MIHTSSPAGLLQVGTSPNAPLVVLAGGNVGIGTASPTAVLHLKAGTATASTAPLKFTSRTLLTTSEAGAVEFLNGAYYGTITTGTERKSFAFTDMTAIPGTDHTANGPHTNDQTAGATITVMNLVILNSSSKWVQTDANASATYAGTLAISLESKNDTQAMDVALPGSFVRDDTWNWTPGQVLYMSETAATITATQPTTTDAAIRVVGYAVTADVIYFDPSPDYIIHT